MIFKEGDKAWTSAVWSKTRTRSKLQICISEVIIEKIFEDGTCLAIDAEDVGMYLDISDLLRSKIGACVVAMNGIKKWEAQELIKEH